MKKMLKVMTFLTLLVAVAILVSSTKAAPRQPVTIKILTVSDWHAQLDPLAVGTSQIGGAAALSTYFQQERAANPNTLTLTAGDAYGASPPLASFFDEEPAILAMNMMGFNADTFGNHNFDGGIAELQNLVNLADFPYVSANLLNRDDNLSGVQDYALFDVAGVKVAIVGLTNPEAPTLVFPGNFGTIVPTNPVSRANQARAAAQQAGAKVFIAMIHSGITGFDPLTGAAFGPLIDFANNVGGFNLIVGDHTDFQYSGVHNNTLVVENRSKGMTYARINLTVDPQNGRILDRNMEFISPIATAVTPDPAIVNLLAPYREALAPIFNTVLGSSTRFIPRADACGRADGRLCESLIGNVTTDAMRQAYGADFAITNSGGLRADLTCPTTDLSTDFCPAYSPPPYPISRGQVLAVLPFGNVVVTVAVNGAELKTMLENGVSAMPGANGRFPQVSGLCFTYDISAPALNRVTSVVRQAADGSCTGPAVDLSAAASYTIAMNDFMATGGDGYPAIFGRATTRDIMDNVLADYIGSNVTVNPTIQGRIVCTTSGGTLCPTVIP
jgi:2',3'-cyclic-nucleotide 2'-phosphodiesterase (5'-nucleotidase family)